MGEWQMDAQVWDTAFSEWLARNASANTREAYRAGVAQFVYWMVEPENWRARAGKRGSVGRVPELAVSRACPWRLTVSDIERWQAAMVKAGLSAATIGSRLSALSAFYEHCRKKVMRSNGHGPEPLCVVNPVAGVDRPRVAPRKRVVLSAKQVRALIQHQRQGTVSGLRNRALLTCYLLSGLRNSEIRNLRWGDFSVDDAGVVRIFWTGKGQKGDERKIRPGVLDAIKKYLGAAGRLPGIADDEFIFLPLSDDAERFPNGGARGEAQPISRQRVNSIIKGCARRAGLKAEFITTHTLRRTAATAFYEASGYDIERTRQMLSHARVETTIRYVNQEHLDADEVWQTVEAWYGL